VSRREGIVIFLDVTDRNWSVRDRQKASAEGLVDRDLPQLDSRAGAASLVGRHRVQGLVGAPEVVLGAAEREPEKASGVAIDELDPAERDLVRLTDAPFLEGAVLAGVTAAGGASIGEVAAAAEGARDIAKWPRD